MYFLVRPNWKRLNKWIWKSLEKSEFAPSDMYIELLRYLGEKLGIPDNASKPSATKSAKNRFGKYIMAMNDPLLAKRLFRRMSIPTDERLCISILEGFYGELLDFSPEIAHEYQTKLREFAEEHNLRYTVTSDCRFELTVQGLLMTQCAHLNRSVSGNRDRRECLKELQNSLARLEDPEEERNCIRIASNLLEGLAIDRCLGATDTLGSAIDRCSDLFPHSILSTCVKNLYKFCNDYPNIRHAGNPASRIRDLKKDDALMMVAVIIGFGSFIVNNNASTAVLSGDALSA